MGDQTVNDPDTTPPFRKHRVYYIVLKFAVLAVAAAVALKLLGYW